MNEKSERLEELERMNEKKRKELLKKINDMIKKKEEYEVGRLKKLEEAKQKRKEFNDICQENKKDIIEDRLERREEILEDENILFNRGLNKDNVTERK